MARTYEAFSKSKNERKTTISPPIDLQGLNCPDLLSEVGMIDLMNEITMNSQERHHKVFNFVCSRQGEGTSTVIINLARMLASARSQKKILLIDGNFENPVLHVEFNIPVQPGLSNLLLQENSYADAIQTIGINNVRMIPVGASSAIDYSAIEQKDFTHLLSVFKKNFDYILIDSPPLLSSSASLHFAVGSDSIYLIIRAHAGKYEIVDKAKLLLNKYNCHINGVILNQVIRVIPDWLYKRL